MCKGPEVEYGGNVVRREERGPRVEVGERVWLITLGHSK